jgi:hypothetical protein
MINSRKSPPRNNVTSPRRDPNTRISKPARPKPNKPSAAATQRYLSQDEQSRQYVADEDKFVLKQSKKKADIRVREGRAKAIDYLAFNLRYIDTDRDVFDDDEDDVDIDVPSPSAVITRLNSAELQELDTEITSYHTLEINPQNREYWSALQSLCRDRREKLRPLGPEGRAMNSVSSDVEKILAPKNLEQLEKLEVQIRAKLRSEEVVDTDYWEQLLKSLVVFKSKAKLQRIYQNIKESRIKLLKDLNPDKANALLQSEGSAIEPKQVAQDSTQPTRSIQPAKPPAMVAAATAAAPPGTARFAAGENEDFSQATRALYEREVARGIGENEEIFTSEETVGTNAQPQWADKYRPRKPRSFNRVQMGYEWNKYNQTHYDHDNPPPKVVQGYKFNIFYPDLIDRTKAPTFKIIREHGRRKGESFAPTGEADTCLIRFIAGPPYEDIAFRIVDREWDYSAKKERGFKNTFDKVCFIIDEKEIYLAAFIPKCSLAPISRGCVMRMQLYAATTGALAHWRTRAQSRPWPCCVQAFKPPWCDRLTRARV